MDLNHRITRVFHDEHMATMALMRRLRATLTRDGNGAPPDLADLDVNTLLRDIAVAVEGELTEHFAFEEDQLFPRLAELGDGEIGAVLTEEHNEIMPLGRRLTALSKGALQDGFTEAGWAEFRSVGRDFVDRIDSHIEKEEMGLVMALDSIIDEADDARLSAEYAVKR